MSYRFNPDELSDADKQFIDGCDVGSEVVRALLLAARAGGLTGLHRAVTQLTEDQARWGLVALAWVVSKRSDDLAAAIVGAPMN